MSQTVTLEKYANGLYYKRCFMFIWTNLKMALLIYFSLYWEMFDLYGLVWSPGIAVFNLGLQQRGPTGPIQPKIGGHLEKEGALT